MSDSVAAEATTLTLRLRLPSGGTHTLRISSEASLVELFEAVAEAAGQEAEGLAMSSGFPPKAIEPDESAKVGSTVQNMETITVARSGASTGQAAAAAGKKFRKPGMCIKPFRSLSLSLSFYVHNM